MDSAVPVQIQGVKPKYWLTASVVLKAAHALKL